MRQYGRQVQMMVEEAKRIQDRDECLAFCERIVAVMTKFVDQSIRPEDLESCLWNHLAYIADYSLDIDYPCMIIREDGLPERRSLTYPQTQIRRRHYGRMIESLAQQFNDELTGDERDRMILLMAARIKRNLSEYRADISNIDKIAEDIDYYTDGKVSADEVKTVCSHRVF